jgi:ABC-type sulfate transport system permease component
MPVLVFERFEGFGLAAATPVATLLLIASLVVFLVLQALLSPSQTKDKSTGSADGESAPMSH